MEAEKHGWKTPAYRSFLVRMWQQAPHGEWRVTVEDPHHGERHALQGLEALFQFILTKAEVDKSVTLLDRSDRGGDRS